MRQPGVNAYTEMLSISSKVKDGWIAFSRKETSVAKNRACKRPMTKNNRVSTASQRGARMYPSQVPNRTRYSRSTFPSGIPLIGTIFGSLAELAQTLILVLPMWNIPLVNSGGNRVIFSPGSRTIGKAPVFTMTGVSAVVNVCPFRNEKSGRFLATSAAKTGNIRLHWTYWMVTTAAASAKQNKNQ